MAYLFVERWSAISGCCAVVRTQDLN